MKILVDIVRKIRNGKALDEQEQMIAEMPIYSIFNFSSPEELIKNIQCRKPRRY